MLSRGPEHQNTHVRRKEERGTGWEKGSTDKKIKKTQVSGQKGNFLDPLRKISWCKEGGGGKIILEKKNLNSPRKRREGKRSLDVETEKNQKPRGGTFSHSDVLCVVR